MTVAELETGEKRPAWVGFSALTVVMAAHAVMETARDSLFLSGVPARQLPYAYLAIAALSWGVLRAKERFSARVRDKRRLLASTLTAVGAIDLVFWALLSPSDVAGLFALYIWSGLVATVVTIQFWLLLDDSVTVTQAKRLFGPIAAGGVAGALLGSVLARALVAWTEPRHLLVLAALLCFCAAALPRHLVFEEDGRGPSGRRREEARVERRNGAGNVLLLRGYLRRLLAFVLLATMTVTGIDYLFKAQAAAALPARDLAHFFATFYVGLNATALVVQLVVSGALLRRVGVNRALAVMPALLLAFAIPFAWAPGIGAAMLLRGTDGALRHSLHRTGVEILYLPLAGEARSRIKAVVDGIGHRGGQALASVMVLGAVSVGLGTREIGFILVGLLVLWLLAIARVRSSYLELFRASIERRAGPRSGLPELDVRSLSALFAALNDTNDRLALAAVDLLDAEGKTLLLPHTLLFHRSKAVVLRALEAFARDRTLGAEETVARLLASPDPELRGAALRTLVAIDPDRGRIDAMANDPSAGVRATALVGALVTHAGTPDVLRARLALSARNGSPSTRSAIAQAVRVQPYLDAPELLLALLDGSGGSKSGSVDRETLSAMASQPNERFVPALVPRLARGATRAQARRALVAIGAPALAALGEALEQGDAPRRLRRHLPSTIARFDAQPAAELLVRRLPHERDSVVANGILRALCLLRGDHPELRLEPEALEGTLNRLFDRSLELLVWEVAGTGARGGTPTAELLLATVREEQRTALSSIFLVLELLHPDEGFAVIRRGLESGDRRVRSAGREILDHALAGDARRSLVALVDEGPAAERLGRARRALHVGRFRPSHERDLASMLEDGSEALRSIAAERIGELGLIGLMGALRRARDSRPEGDGSREAMERSIAMLNAALLRRLPGVA